MQRPRSARSSSAPPKLMPFSMILQPEELSALRRIARSKNVPVAAVIRYAIDSIILKEYPDHRRRIVEKVTDEFLERLSQRLPSTILTPAKRSAFKRHALKEWG